MRLCPPAANSQQPTAITLLQVTEARRASEGPAAQAHSYALSHFSEEGSKTALFKIQSTGRLNGSSMKIPWGGHIYQCSKKITGQTWETMVQHWWEVGEGGDRGGEGRKGAQAEAGPNFPCASTVKVLLSSISGLSLQLETTGEQNMRCSLKQNKKIPMKGQIKSKVRLLKIQFFSKAKFSNYF